MPAPIDGQVLLLAGAKASVPADRLHPLVDRADAHLRDRREEYDRRYERVDLPDGRVAYLVDTGHWATVGDDLGFADREADAVRRAHRQQLLRHGHGAGRREEFETALEIREAVVVGSEASGPDG